MSKVVVDDSGAEETLYTAEELEAQRKEAVEAEVARLKEIHEKELAAEKEHTAKKLDEFQRAKNGAATQESEAKTLAEQAKIMAEEAKAAIAKADAEKIETKKEYWIKSVVGEDPELTKQIKENWALISLPESTDEEIKIKMQKAITMAGIGAIATPSGISFSGAAPINIQTTDKSVAEHNYEVWKTELGLQDLIPKNNK